MRAFRVPSAARATAQRLSTCATLLLLFVVICQHSSAQTSPPDKKQLEATSRQLIAEGKALEDHGELAEAKNKYIDAEGVFSTGTALDGIHRINDEIKQKVESLLADVHRLYDSGKTAQSIEQVRQGLDLDRTNPALHYDLALCYLRQGDRENAALQLDLAIGDVSNRRQREELLELRSKLSGGQSDTVTSTTPGSVVGIKGAFGNRLRVSRGMHSRLNVIDDETRGLSRLLIRISRGVMARLGLALLRDFGIA